VPDLAARLLDQLTATPELPDPTPAFARIASDASSAAGGAVAEAVEETAEALADR
jgi:hypothetical protein